MPDSDVRGLLEPSIPRSALPAFSHVLCDPSSELCDQYYRAIQGHHLAAPRSVSAVRTGSQVDAQLALLSVSAVDTVGAAPHRETCAHVRSVPGLSALLPPCSSWRTRVRSRTRASKQKRWHRRLRRTGEGPRQEARKVLMGRSSGAALPSSRSCWASTIKRRLRRRCASR